MQNKDQQFNPPSNQGIAPNNPVPATQNTPDTTPVGLTGSQMPEQKVSVPVGIYIIAGFYLIAFAVSFFDTSQNSIAYTIAILFDLVLAIGLIMRIEAARKIMLWLAGATLIGSVILFLMLANSHRQLGAITASYNATVTRLEQRQLTAAQKQSLEDLQAEIDTKNKLAGKVVTFAYIKLGVTAVETVAVMVYLTRPKVKQVFR